MNANLTEDAIRRQFNAMYGEKVVVHYIVCNNMTEVAEVRRALAKGQASKTSPACEAGTGKPPPRAASFRRSLWPTIDSPKSSSRWRSI